MCRQERGVLNEKKRKFVHQILSITESKEGRYGFKFNLFNLGLLLALSNPQVKGTSKIDVRHSLL